MIQSLTVVADALSRGFPSKPFVQGISTGVIIQPTQESVNTIDKGGHLQDADRCPTVVESVVALDFIPQSDTVWGFFINTQRHASRTRSPAQPQSCQSTGSR